MAVTAGSGQRSGALMVAAAAIAWSTAGVLNRAVDAGSWTQLFWRAAFAALCLLVIVGVQARGDLVTPFRSLGLPGLGVAVAFAIASSTFMLALGRTSVARVLFFQAGTPFVAAFLAWMLLGERLPLRTRLAMVATLAGVATMVGGSLGDGGIAGDGLALTMCCAFSTAIVLTRWRHDILMTPATCVAMVLAACFAGLVHDPLPVSVRDLSLLAVFGAGQMCVGLTLFAIGARRIPAGMAGLITVLEVVLGPLWVWLAYAETPDGWTLLGGAVVLTALLIHAAFDSVQIARRR